MAPFIAVSIVEVKGYDVYDFICYQRQRPVFSYIEHSPSQTRSAIRLSRPLRVRTEIDDVTFLIGWQPLFLKAGVHHARKRRIEMSGSERGLPQDKTFLQELFRLMDKKLDDPDFNVSDFVETMHISHTKFINKVKALTGATPSELFKSYKLNKAAELLRDGKYNVSEVSDMTGFSSLAHFSKVFKKKFGVSPRDYKG